MIGHWITLTPRERMIARAHIYLTVERLFEPQGYSRDAIEKLTDDLIDLRKRHERATRHRVFQIITETMVEYLGLKQAVQTTPDSCPQCGSPKPQLHPAVQVGGEVGVCLNTFHDGGRK